jgi:hypothetical protein
VDAWHSRFGGQEWRVTPAGIELRGAGVQRTAGEPVTMRRVLRHWGDVLRSVAAETGVPLALLMMTVGVEGALRATDAGINYPALRKEPGYTSDGVTPHRISFGPCHVLLSTYRGIMGRPRAERAEAMQLANNLRAGALFIAAGHQLTGWDPILVAARYNSGGLHDASSPASRFHSRWHLRCWVQGAYVHLDRAAQWYGDAVAVLVEGAPRTVPGHVTDLAIVGPPRVVPPYLEEIRPAPSRRTTWEVAA